MAHYFWGLQWPREFSLLIYPFLFFSSHPSCSANAVDALLVFLSFYL